MPSLPLQECYPALWASLIDLPAPSNNQVAMLPSGLTRVNKAASTEIAARFVKLIDEESYMYHPGDAPEQLAYRQGGWLVMRLKQSWLEGEMDKEAYKVGKNYPEVYPPPGVDMTFNQTLSQDGWYLVTGGLGGLGLHCAHALVRHGARKLILTSRRGKVSEEYEEDLAVLQATPGVEVKCEACDTSNRLAVFQLFENSKGGVRGVVHAAGVLIDGNLRIQSLEKLEAVWRGKVDGAVILHEASLKQSKPLDLFVMYSSSSALLGSPGECNYAGANAALESIAYIRRQQGLACTSVQWGVWYGVGFAKAVFSEQLAKSGFPNISKSLGAQVLTALLNRPALEAPTVFCLHPVDWSLFPGRGPIYSIKTDFACFPAMKSYVEPVSGPPPLTEELKVGQPRGEYGLSVLGGCGTPHCMTLPMDSNGPMCTTACLSGFITGF